MMMTVISKQQKLQDERSLARFLVVFNTLLLTVFLAICYYQP